MTLRLAAFLLLLTVAAPAQDAPNFKAPVSKLELADGDTVVFLGDSITHHASTPSTSKTSFTRGSRTCV